MEGASPTWTKPSEIVVIHPGSRNLRIGFGTQSAPRVFPHCVARRLKSSTPPKSQPYLPKTIRSPELFRYVNDKADQLGNVLANSVTSQGVNRFDIDGADPLRVGSVTLNIGTEYFNPEQTKQNVFGEDALNLPPSANFSLQWPMKKGRLHLHRGVGGSLVSALNDLHDIWMWAIKEKLNSNPRELCAVLVISDVYIGEHVKRILDMMFNDMGFRKVFVHLEGVCAAFGAGVPTACVIDVGESKTLVTCVEDGISLKQTRVLMEFGGGDMTQLMGFLFKDSMQWKNPNIDVVYDARLLEKVKETFCHLDIDHCGSVEGEIIYSPPGSSSQTFPISVQDDAMKCVLGLFAPEVLSLTGHKGSHLYAPQAADPQDPHDDFYILQTQRRRGDAEFEDGEDEDGMPVDLKDPVRQETIPVSQVLGIDVVLLQSVDRCDNEDVKRKMLSNIIVVGGGLANFRGVAAWLKNRLSTQMPQSFKDEIIEISTQPKDLPADCCVWRGAALMTHLDTSQELWITSREWTRFGSKVLRERAVFGW